MPNFTRNEESHIYTTNGVSYPSHNTKCHQECGKLVLTHTVENVNRHKHTGRHSAKLVKFKIHIYIYVHFSITNKSLLLIIYPRENLVRVSKELFTKLVFAMLFLLAIKLETA